MLARDYLEAPYSRVLIPDAETGTYTAEIAEFPGCVAQGDTPDEAYRNLEAAAESWIEELVGMGQRVPEPAADNRYSGRVALRLPKYLHRNAAQLAEREGTSLNQFLVSAIAEKVGASNLYSLMTERLERRSVESAVNIAQIAVSSMAGAGAQASYWGGHPINVNVFHNLNASSVGGVEVVGVASNRGNPLHQ